jgi:hypothetical protein
MVDFSEHRCGRKTGCGSIGSRSGLCGLQSGVKFRFHVPDRKTDAPCKRATSTTATQPPICADISPGDETATERRPGEFAMARARMLAELGHVARKRQVIARRR